MALGASGTGKAYLRNAIVATPILFLTTGFRRPRLLAVQFHADNKSVTTMKTRNLHFDVTRRRRAQVHHQPPSQFRTCRFTLAQEAAKDVQLRHEQRETIRMTRAKAVHATVV